jgi:hypothetical protein
MTEQTQQEPTLNLTLKVSQINLILAALDELPRKVGNATFTEIQQQASQQIQEMQSGEIPKVSL